MDEITQGESGEETENLWKERQRRRTPEKEDKESEKKKVFSFIDTVSIK